MTIAMLLGVAIIENDNGAFRYTGQVVSAASEVCTVSEMFPHAA